MRAIGNRSGSHEITYYPNADAMSGLYAEPDRDASLVDRVLRNRGVADDERRDQLHGRYRPVRLRCDMSTLSEVIDESGEASIDLLKIDVERSELDVLRGLSDEDWPKVRQIVAEVHDEADRVAQVRPDPRGLGLRDDLGSGRQHEGNRSLGRVRETAGIMSTPSTVADVRVAIQRTPPGDA